MAHYTTPVGFFKRYAGTSWNPQTETKEQGKERGARELAHAEQFVRDAGYAIQWEIDPDVTSADWMPAYETVTLPPTRTASGQLESRKVRQRHAPYSTWVCLIRDPEGNVCGSLGGVDFGRDGEPWGDPHRRVVEAELASEHCEGVAS